MEATGAAFLPQAAQELLPPGSEDGRSSSLQWIELHEDNRRRAKMQGSSPVAMLGGTEVDMFRKASLEAGTPEFYGEFEVAALGIPGDTADNLLWRLQNEEAEGLYPQASCPLLSGHV